MRCRDNSLYTGITNNVEKRMQKHITGKGSKYVYSRLPFQKILEIKVNSKSDALKLEHKIKKMSKKEKENLIFESIKVK